jgi:tetratricopeptide (TPR) repeat protein
VTTDRARAKAQARQGRAERIRQSWEENYDRLVDGEATLAEILGHSDEKLMEIADLGLTLLRVGKYDQARKILGGLPLLDPYVPYFHMLLGLLHERSGQSWEGLREYETAIDLAESTDPPARVLPHILLNKAKLLVRAGRLDEAEPLVRRLVSETLAGQDPRFQREARAMLRHLESAGGPA